MTRLPSVFDLSPPKPDASAVEVMKWMISVMDVGDKSLMFVSSVLSQCIKWGGLTDKQEEGVSRIYRRLIDAFERGTLAIQGGSLGEDDRSPHNVTHLSAHRAKGDVA